MGNEVLLGFRGEDEGAGQLIDRLTQAVEGLERQVEKLSGRPFRIPTDPAEDALKEVRAELRRLEAAFDRAEKSVSFARVRDELEGTSASSRRLATAQQTLAARGRQLIQFAKNLPPELRKSSTEMDRLEDQTQQATAAMRQFAATGKGVSTLTSTIGQLRTAFGALVAALGVQQILRLGQALISLGSDAVETKTKFDALIPSLRAFTGSTDLAQDVADRLAKTAADLRVPLAGLVDPFLALSAGGKEAGLSIEEINELFEASLVSARAFGKGATDVQRLLTGISQVAGKGAASMEEFRQQIGEAIPNAIPALARGLGITVPEAIDEISSGSLEASKALRALTKGFEELNGEAGRAQIDTLKGDLGGFALAAEGARKALADGLEPGLRTLIQAITETLENNQDLIRSIGELVSGELADLGELLSNLGAGFRGVGTEVLALVDAFESLRNVPILGDQLSRLREIGNALTGVRSEAQETFNDLERFAKSTATEGQKSAEEIATAFGEAFVEQSEAAGVSAEDIQSIQRDLASRLGTIAEESADERAALEKRLVEAIESASADREQVAVEVTNRLIEIEREGVERRAALLRQLVAEAKKAAEARAAAEKAAQEEAEEFIRSVVEVSRETAQQRIEVKRQETDRIKQIEAELQEDILELQREAIEKISEGEDRAEIAEKLTEKIVALEEKAADAIVREQKRIAKAAKEAAEERIEAEKKVQEEFDKSIEKLQELATSLQEVASEGEGDSDSPFATIAEDAREASDAVGQLRQDMLTIFGDVGTSTDPGEFLADGFAKAEDALGGTSSFFSDFTTQLGEASQATQEQRDFTEQLAEALDRARDSVGGLSQITQDTVGMMIQRFAELVERGGVTADEFRQFGRDLGEALEAAQPAAIETSEAIGQVGEQGAAALQQAADAAQQTSDALTSTGEAASEAGVQIATLEDGSLAIVDSQNTLGVSLEESTQRIEELGTAAEDASDPLESVGDAAEKLREPIVGPEQPDQLRDLGGAASEAQGPIQGLAEPVDQLSAGTTKLSEVLPIIQQSIVAIQPALDALLASLSENPVDLETLASQIEGVQEPLTSISTDLAAIQTAVATLSEPLQAVNEAAEPLFGLALEASEDGRFAAIATAFTDISTAAPEIATALEQVLSLFKDIQAAREELVAALDEIIDRLSQLGNEELLAGVKSLTDQFQKLKEELEGVNEQAKTVLEQLAALKDEIEPVQTALDGLAQVISGQVAPAVRELAEETTRAADSTKLMSQNATEAKDEMQRLGDVGAAAMQRIVIGAQAASAALRELAAQARETAAAVAEVDLP